MSAVYGCGDDDLDAVSLVNSVSEVDAAESDDEREKTEPSLDKSDFFLVMLDVEDTAESVRMHVSLAGLFRKCPKRFFFDCSGL